MLKDFVLPDAVVECWMFELLGAKAMLNGCKIVDLKPCLLSKEVIEELIKTQIFTSSDSVSSYKISVQKKGKSKTHIHTKRFTFINSNCCLPYGDVEKKDGESMREYEDRLTERMLKEQHQQSLKPQSYSNLIKNLEKEVDLVVVEPLRAGERFEDIPGYKVLLKKIISNYYGKLNINSGRRGHIIELELALILEEKENEQIEAFDIEYRIPSANAEFDLVTVSGRFIECKRTEESINKSRILVQAKIAKYHKKQFWVYVEEELSDEMKDWFYKNKISFKDGFKKEYAKAA